MAEGKANCQKCGAEILQRTADRNRGFCVPCRYRDDGPRVTSDVVVERGRSLDWMCIDLRRDVETEDYADYFFSSSVTDKDPRFTSRSMIVGHNVGLFRINKATGETELLYPMPEDEGERRYHSAASTIRKHWRGGKLPEMAMFACG